MSQTFTLQGIDNVLSVNYYPPIDLDLKDSYCLGLIGFHSYHTIPNIEDNSNKFFYGDKKQIVIPPGSYEIANIETYIQNQLLINRKNDSPKVDGDKLLSIKPNNNTLKCEIKSEFDIDFSSSESIGKLLGFSGSRGVLKSGIVHESDLPVEIVKVNTIRIECNIITGAYYDSKLSHTLFEFTPTVDPGYAIIIEPRNILYLPVNTKSISDITIRILDQDGNPVNFRGEKILIRLELKRVS